MIGTPEEVIKRIIAAQKACSFSEITIVPQFGTMPYDEAEQSTRLFAKEVLPVIHKMEAPLNADCASVRVRSLNLDQARVMGLDMKCKPTADT